MKLSHWFVATALAVSPLAALAQHSGHHPAPAGAAATEMSDGEIRRIDHEKGTVLLKHGEIRNLNMGAMTMGFKLKDPAAAKDLKAGDKVKFVAEQQGELLIVTQIRKAP